MLLFLVAAKLQVPKTLDGGSTQNLDTSATVNKARFQVSLTGIGSFLGFKG